jgi:hypothetical protein
MSPQEHDRKTCPSRSAPIEDGPTTSNNAARRKAQRKCTVDQHIIININVIINVNIIHHYHEHYQRS